MYSRVFKVVADIQVDPTRHNGALFVVRGDVTLKLPPLDRSSNCMFSVLPVGHHRVALDSPDTRSLLTTGSGDVRERVTIGGQNVVSVVAERYWLICGDCGVAEGNVPDADETLPKPKPMPKSNQRKQKQEG